MSRLLTCLLLVIPASSWAWGFDGHRRLASLMQDGLPQNHCLRAWFSARQTTALQDKACDPDRWRGNDPDEWPRHFLEVDWVNPPSNYPRDYDAVVRTLGDRVAKSNGTVPWRVEERYGVLVAAFRAKDQAAILDAAFVLSHYVTDAFSILHDTKDSDPNGLHSRWESDMLNVSSNINGITNAAVGYYGTAGRADPRYNTFDVVIVGNGLVPQLVQADVAANGSLSMLYSGTRELTGRRWGDAVTLLSSILWTAWDEAGRPELTGFGSTCSRAAPSGDPVLRGYPPAGGFVHAPDAGSMMDAGIPDAGPGTGGGSGTGGGGAGGGAGGGLILGGGAGGDEEPPGCGCSSAPGLLGLALLLAARRSRRR